MEADKSSAPAFQWEAWYVGIGGRAIDVPEVDGILKEIYENQYPRFNGKVAKKKHLFASPKASARHIKRKAKALGADLVGVCEIEPADIYRGRTIEARYAVVIGRKMSYRAFQTVPSRNSAIECIRVYRDLGEICIRLAQHVRDLGWDCQVEHPIGDSDVLHIPLAIKAGFGELGRHGSLINPDFGPLFRMGTVLTSIPMKTDHSIDAEIASFCDTCRSCRKYCPAKAISDKRDPEAGKDHLGNDRYLVDTGRCFPYFAGHYYCSICLAVCMFNRKKWARDFEGAKAKKFPTLNLHEPPPPYDGIPPQKKHYYPKLKRKGNSETV